MRIRLFLPRNLYVTYPKTAGGRFCYSDGPTYKFINNKDITIESRDVSVKLNLFGKVTGITVTYNNRAYSS